jgi:hypothetical protein
LVIELGDSDMPRTAFRKGQKVRFQFGYQPVEGVIREDRGPLGVKGRHLYLIEFGFDERRDTPMQIELPAERFQVIEPDAAVT